MNKNITTSERIHGKKSEEFEMKVEVHQDSVLCPLFFFAVEIDKITKD